MVGISDLLYLQCLVEIAFYHQDAAETMFHKFKAETDLVYTSEEEMQHYRRFKADLTEEGFTKHLSLSQLKEIFINSRPAIMQADVDRINSEQDSWIAAKGQLQFNGLSYGDILKRHGGSKLHKKRKKQLRGNFSKPVVADLPPTFDSRKRFKKCARVIGHVGDQGACNSFGAMSTVGVLNDRLCIRTDGEFNKLLSPAYAAACKFKSFLVAVSARMEHRLQKCGASWQSMDYQLIPPPTPACSSVCPNKKYGVKLSEDLHFAEPPGEYDVPSDVNAIKREIFVNGSVTASFDAYEDFAAYKSGVYKYVEGALVGVHVVKLIGWGTTADTDGYWLAVNSWNEEWGEGGLFRIAFGQCEIEYEVTYGNPKL
ncbi:hypothetical protein FOL47_005757 [Perkinsus chesapeaki]|uniref:Peptidase C1A papain C-terminal domain-containing protein n=1 Tax=Perkinsus chesapeaki TaxID=330153 RepID=A0A7J6LWR0_PERCH|nr:hypothetical protein FOL47_005757 [Perkinsus chesapeaki]